MGSHRGPRRPSAEPAATLLPAPGSVSLRLHLLCGQAEPPALGRHVLHACARSPRGCRGPTELTDGCSQDLGSCPQVPGTRRGDVTGAAAGGLRTQLPQDGSTCTFETPGFLLSPHSRRHAVSPPPPHLSCQFTPNPVLTCSVDWEKPGLCQERRRDGAHHLSPRGYSRATPASDITAIGTRATSPGREICSDFIYMA